ncbi:MAG: hypothetical protein ABGX47_19735 [Martelella sp.]|uniref:hypothetical protein n=1 Tax=Martelella sp. TaxID=1969699 RepID=UPI003242C972
MNVLSLKKRILFANEKYALIAIAAGFFILNQCLELLIMKFSGFRYAEMCTWDCGWYRSIVEGGYHLEPHAHERMDAANWAFFPVFPLFARFVHSVFDVSHSYALLISSRFFFLLSIIYFMKLSKVYFPAIPLTVAASVVALNPFAIYGNVGYTESCFLFFTSAFFYNLKQERFVLSGVVGGVLSAVRLAGNFALIAYLYVTIRKLIEDWRHAERRFRPEPLVLGGMLIPLGLSLYMFFLYRHTGDAFAFSHIQRAWDRSPGNPFARIGDGLSGDAYGKYLALMSVAALIVPAFLLYKRHVELAIFSVLCTLIPLSTGLWSMPRYIFWQTPVLLAIACACTNRKIWILFLIGSVVMQVAIYTAWFNGRGWVI